MKRLTTRDGNCAYIVGAENAARGILRLAAYEDTGLDPDEVVKLEAERDAAVAELEDLMYLAPCEISCKRCEKDESYCRKAWGACRPQWRRPQQWPHWIDNADSYVCSSCGYEYNNPNKLKDGPLVCPNCKRKMMTAYSS